MTPSPAPQHLTDETTGEPTSTPSLYVARGLTRREAVSLLSLLTLGASCGGGATAPSDTKPDPVDPPTPPTPPVKPAGLRDVATTIALPAGSSLVLTTLRVRCMGYPTSLTGNAADIGVSPTVPTMALLVDASNRGIMAAMLDGKATGTQSISPRSTAVTLLWFALGGPMLRADMKATILAQLSADPAVDTLASVVASRIAADPLAIMSGDTQIASALSAAMNTLTAAASASSWVGAMGASASTQQADPPVIVIAPETDQSNVNVRLSSQVNGIGIANSGRRRVRAFVYATATTTNGVTTNIVPARLIGSPIDLGEPDAYTAAASVRALLGLATPFRPVASAPIPLPLDGDSEQTVYEVVVVGASTRTALPAFFSAARYAPHVAAWNDAIQLSFARLYYCDIIYALLLEFGSFGSIVPNAPSIAFAASEAQRVLPVSVPQLPTIPDGPNQLTGELQKSLQAVFDDPAARELVFTHAPTLLDNVDAAAFRQVARVDWNATLKNGYDFVMRLASPLNNYKPNGTLAKIFDDLNRSDRANLWTATVSKSSIRILPVNPAVFPGGQQVLTIERSPDLTSTYEYEWSSSAAASVLSANGEANVGKNITTRQSSVTFQHDDTDTGDIVIDVRAYDVVGRRRIVGQASTTITLLPFAQITPHAAILRIGDRQTFTVTVPGGVPNGVKYLWNLTGSAGSIGTLNLQTTTVPTITYTAIRRGTDTLDVQVVDANDRLLAKGSEQVRVDPPEFITVAISGTWDPKRTPANGVYTYRDHDSSFVPSPGGNGLKALFIVFNLADDDTIGILVSCFVPANQPLVAGQTWSKLQGGQPTAGVWQLTMSQDQNDVKNSQQFALPGVGQFRLDTLSRTNDNRWTGDFSFQLINAAGGTATGTGKATWV